MKKESTWEECVESNSLVSVSPDKAKSKSLIDIAVGRNQFLDKKTKLVKAVQTTSLRDIIPLH